MAKPFQLNGVVTAGERRGASFIQIRWVQAGLERLVGFRAYPGTLNLRLESDSDKASWSSVREGGGFLLPPEQEGFCEARLFPCRVGRPSTEPSHWQRAAAILPQVEGYPADGQVELIAPVRLRDMLGVKEGDRVEVQFGG